MNQSQRPTLQDQLDQLAAAGITTQDVEAVVDHRLRSRRAEAAKKANALKSLGLSADVTNTSRVPEPARWGKGPTLTDSDFAGYFRVVAVARANLEKTAASAPDPDEVDDARRATVNGMLRREAEGKHQINLSLIASARRDDQPGARS